MRVSLNSMSAESMRHTGLRNNTRERDFHVNWCRRGEKQEALDFWCFRSACWPKCKDPYWAFIQHDAQWMDPLKSVTWLWQNRKRHDRLSSVAHKVAINSLSVEKKIHHSPHARWGNMNDAAWSQLSVPRQMWTDSTRPAKSCPVKLWNHWILVWSKTQSSIQENPHYHKTKVTIMAIITVHFICCFN